MYKIQALLFVNIKSNLVGFFKNGLSCKKLYEIQISLNLQAVFNKRFMHDAYLKKYKE